MTIEKAPTYYFIQNRASGAAIGHYPGSNPKEAIAAMMADAGCTDEPSPDLFAEALVYESGAVVENGDGVVYTEGPREDWDYGRVDIDGNEITIEWLGSGIRVPLTSTKGLAAYLNVDGAKAAFSDAVAAAVEV